jgi:hypothetical protein
VARKRKKKPFEAVKAVKAAAREHIGVLPPAQVVPNRKEKAQTRKTKHKPTLEKLLTPEE